jgi:GDP-fucose transporter C1
MVMVNKAVLNSIAAPCFLLFCQLVIAVIMLQLSAALGACLSPPGLVKSHLSVSVQQRLLNPPDHQRRDLQRHLVTHHPQCRRTHIQHLLSPICRRQLLPGPSADRNRLSYLITNSSSLPRNQVARGLVLPFTVFFSYILLGTRSSLPTLGAVLTVCIGFYLGVSGEHLSQSVSFLGVFLGILSSITTSVHAIIVKRSLAIVPSSLDLAYYSNALSAVALLPILILVGEVPTVLDMFLAGGEQLKTFVVGALVTGVFGFLICIAGFLSIKVTSPITHMISSGELSLSLPLSRVTRPRCSDLGDVYSMQRRRSDILGCLAIRRHHHVVCIFPLPFVATRAD